MTSNDIFREMGKIDASLVMDASPRQIYTKKAKGHFIKWTAAAACLCFAVAALAVTFMLNNDNRMIASYKGSTNSCYSTPAPGEYFCFTDVNEAREHYKGKNVTFLLGFSIFGTDTLTEEQLNAEYQRLAGLGYKLYRVEDHWTYYGHGQRRYIPIVVGAFTEEQLADFDVNPKYGYTFYFESNGDGSAIRVDEEDLITHFHTWHS
ncbi:MAG: hypothetical protein IJY08_04085 [Clostridia bacterium]|nr:hypothetical protein [Clostridia bacterium]